MGTEFFSTSELTRLRSWPAEIGPAELIRYFTLDSAELDWLASCARGESNPFGLAVQLCALPWLGFVPDDAAAVPAAAATRLATQLGIRTAALAGYGQRAQTRTDHLRLVTARSMWRPAGSAEWKDLAEFLLARAVEHDAPGVLFGLACEYCTGARIVRPGPVPLMRAVATAREQAAIEVFLRVEPLLGGDRRAELDGLLRVAGADGGVAAGVAAPRGDLGLADGDPRRAGQVVFSGWTRRPPA